MTSLYLCSKIMLVWSVMCHVLRIMNSIALRCCHYDWFALIALLINLISVTSSFINLNKHLIQNTPQQHPHPCCIRCFCCFSCCLAWLRWCLQAASAPSSAKRRASATRKRATTTSPSGRTLGRTGSGIGRGIIWTSTTYDSSYFSEKWPACSLPLPWPWRGGTTIPSSGGCW